jgi:hypothetical protein
MGYFDSQDAAEKLLDAVRDVYPAAWAGLAPTSGAPRRNRVAAMPAVTVAPMPVVVPAAVMAAAPAVELAPVMPAPVIAPVVEPPPEMLETMSNVRDVIAQLSETNVPRLQPAARAAAPDLNDAQVLQVLENPVAVAAPAPAARKPAPPVAPALPVAAAPPIAPAPSAAAPDPETEVRVVTPEDTQTLTDIRIDAQNNAPPCFAVQLVGVADRCGEPAASGHLRCLHAVQRRGQSPGPQVVRPATGLLQ